MVPKSSFFICHTMRSGSTLLCDALSSTGVAGYAEEYFPERSPGGEVYVTSGAALKDPATWLCDWTSTPFEECLDRVLRCGTTPNGVFASKVRWLNMPYLGEMITGMNGSADLSLAEQLDSVFPNCRYVCITRRDKVRQAVSLVKARQSKQWKAMSAEAHRPDAARYNFRLIEAAVGGIVQQECAWEEYFTHAGITPISVIYEDFVRSYEPTVRQLLADLKIDLTTDYVFPPPGLQKQADGASEGWVERYHRDARKSRTRSMVANLPTVLGSRPLRETYVVPRLHTRIDRLREGARTRIAPPGQADLGVNTQRPREECGKPARRGDVAIKRRRRLGLVLAVVVLGIVVSLATALGANVTSSRLPSRLSAGRRVHDVCRHDRAASATACVPVSFADLRHRV
jgi:trehalose 2-sulfotransferase